MSENNGIQGRTVIRAVNSQASNLEELVKESVEEVAPVADKLEAIVHETEENIKCLDEDSDLYKESVVAIEQVKLDHPDIFDEEEIIENKSADDYIEEAVENLSPVDVSEDDEPVFVVTPSGLLDDDIEPLVEEMVEDEPEAIETPVDVPEEVKIEPIPVAVKTPVIDDPSTPLIETSWSKPNPAYKNGKLLLNSKADGKQHVFEASTEEEAKAIAYAELALDYDVSNLVL